MTIRSLLACQQVEQLLVPDGLEIGSLVDGDDVVPPPAQTDCDRPAVMLVEDEFPTVSTTCQTLKRVSEMIARRPSDPLREAISGCSSIFAPLRSVKALRVIPHP